MITTADASYVGGRNELTTNALTAATIAHPTISHHHRLIIVRYRRISTWSSIVSYPSLVSTNADGGQCSVPNKDMTGWPSFEVRRECQPGPKVHHSSIWLNSPRNPEKGHPRPKLVLWFTLYLWSGFLTTGSAFCFLDRERRVVTLFCVVGIRNHDGSQ